MDIFINTLNKEVISIVISGDFTIGETDLFDSVVLPIFDRDENNIILDMANLVSIDSFGIAKLFSSSNMAKLKGKNLYIMNIRKDIEELFNTLKLLRYYTIIEPTELKNRFGIKKIIK